jgi:23S rRNA pseudouridine2605 synthase
MPGSTPSSPPGTVNPALSSRSGNMERLQKFLARAGVASRRGAEDLVREGRIRVNDQVVTAMGCKITPGVDKVTVDGHPVSSEHKIYILLNKPAGYVTTLSDPQGRPIVSDLVADLPFRLFPVGRLDLDTEGALLMTNDGDLGNLILHPRYEVTKTYEALLQGCPEKDAMRRLERGILLEGTMTSPARIRLLARAGERSRVEITIHEGRKRQVRKMFQAINHRVLHLKRIAYGKLKLGSLPLGKYRVLSIDEVKKIFSGKNPFTIKNIPA